MKKSNYLFLLIFILAAVMLFNSCDTNKTVYLYPQEPFEYIENDIHFSITPHQNWWIPFQSPHVKNPRFTIPFLIRIQSDEKIESVHLRSLSLVIKELNVEIIKENLMFPIENRHDEISAPEFTGYISIEILTTEDIVNSFSEKITFEELYKEFKRVDEVEFHSVITYSRNEKTESVKLIWTYDARRDTSLAWWDTMMSV
ncbi:MAG TPA: hypothetical protein DEQ14_07495 [Treponema sp.]|nr:hypothetical protein [Treponema sp.]